MSKLNDNDLEEMEQDMLPGVSEEVLAKLREEATSDFVDAFQKFSSASGDSFKVNEEMPVPEIQRKTACLRALRRFLTALIYSDSNSVEYAIGLKCTAKDGFSVSAAIKNSEVVEFGLDENEKKDERSAQLTQKIVF